MLQNLVSAPFIANQFEFTVDSIRNPGNMGGFSNPIMVFTSKSDDTVIGEIFPQSYDLSDLGSEEVKDFKEEVRFN